jgi:radical SAM/Cys-rich protein
MMPADPARRLPMLGAAPDFAARLATAGRGPLRRGPVRTLQVNLGRRCNQACHHCHVDAGPKRTEVMTPSTVAAVVAVLAANPAVEEVDLTGGAPELCPSFRDLVRAARALGRRVIDRCNLTILHEPGQEDLAEFLAANQVHVVASLPCYQPATVDRQRGHGVFDKSVAALRWLNREGYGRPGTGLTLDLVYNPGGPSLPPPQAALEAQYKVELARHLDIAFDHLLTITNVPIRRFADDLVRSGRLEAYLSLLVNHFNPATLDGLMCRSTLSVAWDGALYDCDFNQMLAMPLGGPARTLADLARLGELDGTAVAVGSHCFACTAGAGSSCGGALA